MTGRVSNSALLLNNAQRQRKSPLSPMSPSGEYHHVLSSERQSRWVFISSEQKQTRV